MSETEQQQQFVRLVYRRDGKAYTFSGSVTTEQSAPEGGAHFHNCEFEQVMSLVSVMLQKHSDHRLFVKREEAPYPMTLPANIEHLLRTDLPKALEALSIGPQRIVVGAPRQVNLGGMPHGLDTLADALGEKVYIKFRYSGISAAQVEDPVTGRWVLVEPIPNQRTFHCGGLLLERQVATEGHHWCTARTEDILGLRQTRYYLPRGWNPSEGWIAHDDLQAMFESYKEEKENAARS